MSKTVWDLSLLFKNEEELSSSLETCSLNACKFEQKYKNTLKKISPNEFNECIKEYENISQNLAHIATYAYLKFAQNSDEGAFLAKIINASKEIEKHILFFEIEFNRLNKKTQNIFIKNAPKYDFYLRSLTEEKPHQLTLGIERVLLKKEQVGVSAWGRLFDEHFSNMKFTFEGKKLSEEEILSFLHSADRNKRRSAAAAFTKELKKHQHLLGFIFNMIKSDLKTECEIRKYKIPEEPRHKDNKISQKSVDALIRTVEENFGIVGEYYEKKREILGLDTLYDYDRYAPLDKEETLFSYEEACEIVLKTFKDFSPIFYETAKKAFNNGWIDVYPKSKKSAGAFSHSATANTHPYILLNYTNQRRDLFTLAHEMGHAIHQYLSYEVGYLSSDTPLTTAETASVFSEMLLFDEIKKTCGIKAKRAMLSAKIDDIFATLYRQINFTTFERAVHADKNELSLKEFNKIWLRESAKMFAHSVKFTPNYKIWWSYIPHFIHSPFYCYAYAYAQLLVMALFGLYKSGTMRDFRQKYIEFLTLGGSKSPKEMVGIFGFDIEDDKFWQIGINEVKKLVDEFKEL
ncbi:MAG: M3 family oligoendopeptidase [Campylobacteraceae bacterium]|jgi:oligoendopeptidase F|nr:M3 family oligoendopeptidase [Campylobacteraceae bacterium]